LSTALLTKPLTQPTNQITCNGKTDARIMAGMKEPPVASILFSSKRYETARVMWNRILVAKKEQAKSVLFLS
jgi:hypothetical protein